LVGQSVDLSADRSVDWSVGAGWLASRSVGVGRSAERLFGSLSVGQLVGWLDGQPVQLTRSEPVSWSVHSVGHSVCRSVRSVSYLVGWLVGWWSVGGIRPSTIAAPPSVPRGGASIGLITA